MRILILLVLVVGFSAFGLEKHHQVQLAPRCYREIEILRRMFRTGEAPAECRARVIVRYSRPPQVVPEIAIGPDDLRSHLIGKLAHIAGDTQGDEQIQAIFNFFAITRIPDVETRGWAIRIFYKSVFPKLSVETVVNLNARLATYWARHTGNREQLEVLIAPIILAMPSEAAATRLVDLDRIASDLGESPPVGRSDIELRGIQTISNEWERLKRNHPAIQAALIYYIARDKDLPDENLPESEYERQELKKRQDVRAEAVKALTNRVTQPNSFFKIRRQVAGITAENVAKVVELLDARNPSVVISALEVIGWQFAQEWVVTERANEELLLHAKLAALLRSPNIDIRHATANAYALMHPPQAVSQIALVQSLDTGDEQLRAKAIEALSIRSTYHSRRVADPAVFREVIRLAIEGTEAGRSDAAALLRQNSPFDLETITVLVERYSEFNPAIQPIIRDVVTAAAKRRTGLVMFQENAGLELELRQRLSAALASGALCGDANLKGLLAKRNLDTEKVIELLASPKPEEVVEAAEILGKTRPALIRPLVHKHVEAPRRVAIISQLLKATNSATVGEILLELLGDEDLVSTVGRNPSLFAAVVNPSSAALSSERSQTAYAAALRRLAERPGRLHSSLKNGNTEVTSALASAINESNQFPDNLLQLLRLYELTQNDRAAALEVALRCLIRWMEEPKMKEARRKAVEMIRARVPIPNADSWAGALGRAYENDPTPEMKRMVAEIFVSSYQTLLPTPTEPGLFGIGFRRLREEPFAEPPEILDAALTELGGLLERHAEASEVDSEGALARCAVQIAGKKKK